jgi:hypothetical protein
MSGDWSQRAVAELVGLVGPDGSWGYSRGAGAFVEPTALAALAITAHATGGTGSECVRGAAEWLAGVQRPDGSLGLSRTEPTPCWPTPYALLLWQGLGSHGPQARHAAEWLLGQKGRTISRSDDPGGVAGHDTTLVGWPWVADTHSWLEPTVLAVLALGVAGHGGHARVREGLALIRNRAVASGGWNYGNRAVFGRQLRAQPAPTGMALLALATIDENTPTVDRAIAYLRERLPSVRAPMSLGWGLLGLRAWGVSPGGSSDWLEEAFAAVSGRSDAAPMLATLLLAEGPDSLRLFGRSRTRAAGRVAAESSSGRNEANHGR